MNTWDRLPNAKHIDRVLSSLRSNQINWFFALSSLYTEFGSAFDLEIELDKLWQDTHNTALSEIESKNLAGIWYDVKDRAWRESYARHKNDRSGASWYMSWEAVCNVCMALIAYDDSFEMMNSDPDELRVLIALGDDRAMLMLPAAIVFSEEK